MLRIIEKNKNFVIIYKPAGIPSQSDQSGDNDAMTMTSELLTASGENGKLFLIHRLDRVVGGLLVFARNKEYAAILSGLVASQGLNKEYFAVVEGRPDGGRLCDYIYKDSTLSKAFVTDRKRAGVKEAMLDYTVLDSVDNHSLVKVSLKTGRFHQIRAQFSSRGWPLVGDKKYGSRDARVRQPALFASYLSFEVERRKNEASILPPIDSYPWSLFAEEKYRGK